MTSARVHPLLWAAIAAFAVMTAIVLYSPLPVILDFYLHDDSFYYLKTAENFAAGHGSTFDGINYSNGYQPAWFVVLTGLFSLGVGHDSIVKVAIAFQAALFATGLLVLSRALARTGIMTLYVAAAIGIVYIGLVPAVSWNLLESGLTALTSACLLLALSYLCDDGINPFWLGLALSAAALTRTDHLLFLPIGGAVFAWQRWNADRLRSMPPIVMCVLPIVVLVGGYLAINLVTTGHLMPVSGLVKSAYTQWNVRDALAEFLRFDVRKIWKIGLAGALVLVIRDIWRGKITGLGTYSLGAIGICAYYQVTYAPVYSASFWYYIPLYNLLCYWLAVSLQAAGRIAFRDQKVAVAAMSMLVSVFLSLRVQTIQGYRSRGEAERTDIYRVALELRNLAADPAARIGAWDSGILGFYGGRVTNLDGLINSAGYFDNYLSKKRTPEYIRENGFQYIACFESDIGPGGRAAEVLDDYSVIWKRNFWVILKRNK